MLFFIITVALSNDIIQESQSHVTFYKKKTLCVPNNIVF